MNRSFLLNFTYFLFLGFLILGIWSCADREYNNLVQEDVIIVDKTIDLKKAGKKLSEGKVDDALGIFNAILKDDESNVDANVGLAGIYLSKNQFSESIKYGNKALEEASAEYTATFNPKVSKRHIHLILAQAYFYTGDFNKSNDQIRQVVGRNVNLQPDALAKELQRLAR